MPVDTPPPMDDSSLLGQVRKKLRKPAREEGHWAALAAAAFFAVCAIGFAAATILAPDVKERPAAKSSVR
jgi:hypothetical protein